MNRLVQFAHESLLPYPKAYSNIRKLYEFGQDAVRNVLARNLPLDHLLVGGENGIQGGKYARLTNNPMRCSESILESPHLAFIEKYKEIGEAIFEPKVLMDTRYYRNAMEAIDLCGYYFGAQAESQIVDVARSFIQNFQGEVKSSNEPGRSRRSSAVSVRRVALSDNYYEIVDGHHRLAIACAEGQVRHAAYVLSDKPVTTPMQDLLLDCLWTRGERIRYQPLELPETKQWRLVRNCEDRLGMMEKWIDESNMPEHGRSYLDVGCSYGWFVDQMKRIGFAASGVERDTSAIKVGQAVYGLPNDSVIVKEIVNFCTEASTRYDIVSCFSVLHHFVLNKSRLSADEFIQHLDRLTGEALFLDTGQAHERWFSSQLSEWTDEYIADWIRRNTSFTNIQKLGEDTDNVGKFANNYRRSLFVCSR